MVGIENIKFKNNMNASNIAFNGHNLSQNEKGEKTYKFFLPKLNYNNAMLILKKFRLDKNGNIDNNFESKEIGFNIPKGNPNFEISSKKLDLTEKDVLGYRFVIDGKPFNDKHRYIEKNGITYNLADLLSTDVLTTPKSIYHLMPSIFNPKLKTEKVTNALGETIINDDKTARMNHFMQFDTNIQDIIEKIPYIKEMGFRRILSTPLFGQDNVSVHGYWTANPYQITSKLGTIEDFKDLQINLFKNSMGFIADGAFTDEGLTGIHLRDVMRHGKKSPFVNWFELHNFNSEPLKLGILPDTKKGYENFDIKVVNSPIIWEVNKDGYLAGDFGKKNNNYNPNKETFIQIYDKRLASKKQINSEEVFTAYDIKNTKNKDELSDWMDSVLPYSFPVNPIELKKKANLAIQNNEIPAKEMLKNWENFELTTAKESSGATLWTGNKDIFKLRFTLPASKQEKIMREANNLEDGQKEIENIKASTIQVKDYISEVGEFWTNKTAKTLREYVASQFKNAKTPSEYKKIIAAKAGKELPAEMKYITEKQIEYALNKEYESTKYLPVPATVEEMLKEYPLEALECSDDVLSVFAYPTFKEKANKILYNGVFKDVAAKILDKIDDQNLACGGLIDGKELIEVNNEVSQLIADDITRFILIKSLDPSFNIDDITSYSEDAMKKLKNITMGKLGICAQNPKELESQLLTIMKNNASNISLEEIKKISNILAKKIKNITTKDISVANLIIDKAEAGLNWRIDAAKDIAEIETFLEDEAMGQEVWGEVIDFWNKFNEGVKFYNPHSYKIGEFTDTALSYTDTYGRAKNAGDLEQKLIEQGLFTTQSNYSYAFETLQRIFSGMPEINAGINDNVATLLKDKLLLGWNGVPGYLYSGNKNNIAFSHVAVGNHDKQRIAHTFSINVPLAYINYQNWDNNLSNDIKNDLLSSTMEYSKYFNDINSQNWHKIFDTISPRNLAKMASLTHSFKQALSAITNNQDTINSLMFAYTKAVEELAEKDNPTEKTFFYKTFEDNYTDIVNLLSKKDKNFENFARKIQPLVHKHLVQPSYTRGIELAKLMVAFPGSPTLYAGDEMLQTGGEVKAKNVYLQNRNRLQWEKLSDKNYSHINDYKNQLSKIFNLRNDKDLSALVNGDTILLKDQGGTFGRDITALYRYNDENDAIVLIHNTGFNSNRNFGPINPINIPKIDLSEGKIDLNDKSKGYIKDNLQRENKLAEFQRNEASLGLTNGLKLQAGGIFADALDPSQKFIVKEDGNIYSENGNNITINGAVKILKRIK